MVKPDAFAGGIWFKIPAIYKERGLEIISAKFIQPDRSKMEELYREHQDKFFFLELINFMTSGLMLVLCIRGENAIEKVREINEEIRKIHASHDHLSANVVHGSDSPESAARELKLFCGRHQP